MKLTYRWQDKTRFEGSKLSFDFEGPNCNQHIRTQWFCSCRRDRHVPLFPILLFLRPPEELAESGVDRLWGGCCFRFSDRVDGVVVGFALSRLGKSSKLFTKVEFTKDKVYDKIFIIVTFYIQINFFSEYISNVSFEWFPVPINTFLIHSVGNVRKKSSERVCSSVMGKRYLRMMIFRSKLFLC